MSEIFLNKASGNYGSSAANEELNIRDVVSALLREKWLLITCILVSFLLATSYLIFNRSLYQADVLIQVQDNQSGLGNTISQDMSSILGNSSQSSIVNVQKALITSRYILEPVINKLGLDMKIETHYFPILGIFANKNSSVLVPPKFGLNRYAWGGEKLSISQLQIPANFERNKSLKLVAQGNNSYNLYDVHNNLLLTGKVGETAQAKDKTTIKLNIKVDSLQANPGTEFFITKKDTAKVIDSLANSIDITDLGAKRTGGSTGILQISLIGANPKATVHILNTLADFTVKQDMKRKSEEAEKTYTFLQQQLPLTKAALDKAETRLNQYRAKSGKIDLKLESQLLVNQLSSLEQNVEQLKLQKIQMLQEYTSNHPFVSTINDKINGLTSELNALQQKLKKLPAADQIAVSLMRDVDVKNQLYILLLNKIQEVQVVKSGILSDVRILDYAKIPNEPLSKKPLLVLTAALLFGFLLGAGIIMLRRTLTQRIQDPYWVERNLAIRNLAIVPYSKIQDKNSKQYAKKLANHIDVLALTQPGDMAIESLRSLRTSVQLMLPSLHNNIIGIMGIAPGVGKSFVSVNFAHVLADIGKRVLLIDGDLRRGHLHSYFNKERVPGLSEILQGKASPADIIYESTNPNLDLISTGVFTSNPSELLEAPAFKNLLEEVKMQYDVVLVDTAPIMAVTDGILIAKHASANLLVLGAGEHSKQEVEITLRRLETNNIKLLGTVFNSLHTEVRVYGDTQYSYSYS
jgi:tyrosine-protein kinase Etk/Wzc